MNKQTKIIVAIALLVGGAIAAYFILKDDTTAKEAVDKSLRFLGMKPDVKPEKSARNYGPEQTKDMRYAPSTTGKNAPFVGYTEKPAKDVRFDIFTTGKNERFA